MAGLYRDEMLGREYWHIFPDTLGTVVENEFRRAVRDQISVELEFFSAPRKTWFGCKGYPTAEGGLSIYFRDITEQKEAEAALAKANAELRQANADLEQFGYSVSHDLQEPLRAIAIYSELFALQYSEKLDDRGMELLGYLKNGASRMQMLVRDLLAYTQVKGVDQLEESDAMQVLSETLTDLANAIAENSARITHGELPLVKVHKAHLRQLFQNIIGNALKYRGEGPPLIHVAAERQGGRWLFSFRDNGIGIAAEYRENIFGLFKRLHGSGAYSGTGLGLAICKRIVERYGCRIWVESELGAGATFYFTLPA